MIETIILCTIFGVFILISYTLGLRNGQKISNNKEIESPVVNPIKEVSKELKKFHTDKEQKKLNTIMENIDNYNGTAIGQKDLPE